jgi:hypothetical protein
MLGQHTLKISGELDDSLDRWLMQKQINSSSTQLREMKTGEFVQYIKTLDRSALLEIKNYFDAINAHIKKKQHTEFMPNFNEAETVRRICGKKSNMIQTELSRTKITLHHHFVDVAWEMLEYDVYSKIMSEAYDRHKAGMPLVGKTGVKK